LLKTNTLILILLMRGEGKRNELKLYSFVFFSLLHNELVTERNERYQHNLKSIEMSWYNNRLMTYFYYLPFDNPSVA